MNDDNHKWEPLSVEEVVDLMSGLQVPWWIAGGWAIDLFLGRQTRAHGDTDVLIRRDDQLRSPEASHHLGSVQGKGANTGQGPVGLRSRLATHDPRSTGMASTPS